MAKKKVTPKKAVTDKVLSAKKYDLNSYKKNKNLLQTSTFKPENYLKLSSAFLEAVSIPGIPIGFVTVIRGHSDTAKTTALIEAAVDSQRKGRLPVLIITEMKWSWEHAKLLGFEVNEEVNPNTGEITYNGEFIYIDRGSLNTIEDVAAFIMDILDDQAKGLIPQDIDFFWDSAGSIPCQQSYDSKKNNNMWNAGAMSAQFGNFVNQKIMLSRKDSSPYTNSLIVVNKVRVEYPTSGNPKEMPKMRNKAGDALFWDAVYVITMGNVTGPGVTKLKAVKDGKQVEWAKIVKVSCDKNHFTQMQTSGRIVVTPHGFIRNDEKEINAYKKLHSAEWSKILGEGEYQDVEEQDTSTVAEEKDEE